MGNPELERVDEYLRAILPLSEMASQELRDEDHDIKRMIHQLRDNGLFKRTFREDLHDIYLTVKKLQYLIAILQASPNEESVRYQVDASKKKLLVQMRSLSENLGQMEEFFTRLTKIFNQYGANSIEENRRWDELLTALERANPGIKQQRTNLLTPLEYSRQQLDRIAVAFQEVKKTVGDGSPESHESKAHSLKDQIERCIKAAPNDPDIAALIRKVDETLAEMIEEIASLERRVTDLLGKMYTFERGIGQNRKTVVLAGKDLTHASRVYEELRRQALQK